MDQFNDSSEKKNKDVFVGRQALVTGKESTVERSLPAKQITY
jgi:hypothetical protein